MARPFTPPAGGALADLSDVDVSAGDGLAAGAVLTANGPGTDWTPQIPSQVEVLRQTGPARDTFNTEAVTNAMRDSGEASYDGAIWGLVAGGVVSRVDVNPDGLVQTNGATVINNAAFTSARCFWATTADALYVLSTQDGSPSFHRVDGVDTILNLALPSTAGPLDEADTAIVGLGNNVIALGRLANGNPAAAIYDPWADTWSALTAPADTLRMCRAFAHKGKVYVGPGQGGPAVMRRYDPVLDAWENLGGLPSTLSTPGGMTPQMVGDLAYVFGGVSDGGVELHYYAPELDVWERATATGVGPGNGGITAAIGSRILLTDYPNARIVVYG